MACEETLPSFVGSENISRLFEICNEIKSSSGNIVLNASQVNFFDPLGIAVLAAALEPICNRRSVSMPHLKPDIRSYLERMDFFTRCQVEDVFPLTSLRNDQRRSMAELRCVADESQGDSEAAALATALTGHLTPASTEDDCFNENSEFHQFCYPLQYSLNELLANALTHARKFDRREAKVWIAAQYYKKNYDQVKMAIVDNGCGILETLKEHKEVRDNQTHSSALEAAIRLKVSCNRNVALGLETHNQGIGLTVASRIAHDAGGQILVVSGDSALYTKRQVAEKMSGRAHWSGVAILFTCRRAELPRASPVKVIDALVPKKRAALPQLRFE